MNIPKKGAGNRSFRGIIPYFLPIMIFLLTSTHGGFTSGSFVIDNGDYTFTSTWEFEDMTNYTLENITAQNGAVNLTGNNYFWNQSSAFDFATGQKSNVVEGDGIVISTDDLILGYLQNQNFTNPYNWNYANGTESKVIAEWWAGESGLLYSTHPRNITIQNTILQPGSLNGIDTYLNESDQLRNHGGDDQLRVERGTWERRALLWFDISSLSDTKILDAQLELDFYYSNDGSSVDISAHRVITTSPWAEMNANWQKRDLFNNWDTPGGDFIISPEATITGLITDYGWKKWNITSLVDGWVNGTYENNGVLLWGSSGLNTWKLFHSSEYSDPSKRPILNITYYPMNTLNETANISQNFPILDPGAYRDSSVADFELGESENVTIIAGGEIILASESYFKFDTLDDITDWEEDPATTTGKGSFTLSSTIFYE
ncbi:MAG: DNRLRE domain-containing protein, partial [Thermoplasmata archaeon]